MSQFEYQRQDSAEELLVGWMSELESVLYCAEVEEAIKEVGFARCAVQSSAPVSTAVLLGLPQ